MEQLGRCKRRNELLESENMKGVASDFLVEDSTVDYSTQQSILDAITGGSVFKVDPEEVSNAVDYQSHHARQSGGRSITIVNVIIILTLLNRQP